MIRRIILACLCGAMLFAQTQPEKKTRLEGRVVGLNGEAVRKATVRLQSGGQPAPGLAPNAQGASNYSKTTDDVGKFLFEDVNPGRYTLIAEKTGFLTQRYGARTEDGPGTPIVLAAGDQRKDLEIRMTAQGIITGRVTDEDGDPVANAQVSAARYGYNNGQRVLIQSGAALANALAALTGAGGAGASDDQGNYRVVNLPPGRYYVSANPQGGSAMLNLAQAPAPNGPSEPMNMTTYYPSSLDAQGAAPVDVTGGSEASGVNIRVRKEKVYAIRGKVINSVTGGPAAGAMVLNLLPDGGDVNPLAILSNMSRTGADGSFEIRNVSPGKHTLLGLTIPGLAAFSALTIGAPGVASGVAPGVAPASEAGAPPVRPTPPPPSEQQASTRVEVGVSNSDVTGIVLPLLSGVEIPGTITVDGGGKLSDLMPAPQQSAQPSQTAALTALLGIGGRSVRLAISDRVDLINPVGSFGDDGVFKIAGVFPAKYFVTVSGLPQGAYVKSIKFAGQDITRSMLDMSAGAAGNLEVVLSAKSADFTGTVRNEKGDPMAGVPVTLWPKLPDRGKQDGGIKTANTDQNGSFKVSGLAPGEYYVAAWEDIPVQGLTQNAEFLARFAGDQSGLKLVESAHESIEMKLIPRDRIIAEAAKIP